LYKSFIKELQKCLYPSQQETFFGPILFCCSSNCRLEHNFSYFLCV